MNPRPTFNPDLLEFYATSTYPCSYLEGRTARSQVASSGWPIGDAPYALLIEQGFRRSGTYIYRPHCDDCQACTSIRIPVAAFQANRSQQRAWSQHADLLSSASAPWFSEEHFALYSRYQKARHGGGGMDHDDAEQYANFLLGSQVSTRLVEFRSPATGELPGPLRMVSIIDQLEQGLSAVYTFYDPEPGLSLGTFNVLWQIRLARAMRLKYLYLGYWIKDCNKMAYKSRFQPHELYRNGVWTTS